jgi:hypothetical protein
MKTMRDHFSGRFTCRGLLLLTAMTFSVPGRAEQDAVTMVDTPAAMAIAAGDLDGDGRADIALIEASLQKTDASGPLYDLHLHFQKDGKFSVPADKTIALGATLPSGLAIGDFDGDGRDDIAVGLRGARTFSLFLGADGHSQEIRSRYGNDSGAGGLSVGRVNASGLADFFTGAAWRQWRGKEQFGEAYFSGPERNDNWRSTLADLDRNGTDDVIFTTYWSGSLTVPANNRIRIFYGPFLKMMLLQATDAAHVVTLDTPFMAGDKPLLGQVMVGDLNDDDQLDLVVPAAGQTLVYFQNSPTGFSDGATPSLVLDDVTPLLVTDLDGDRLCDLAFLPTKEAGITLWLQQKDRPLIGAGQSVFRTIPLPRKVVAAAAGDVDGDGRPEMIAALAGGGVALVTPQRQ